ncbi:hypothetical protein [Parasegetibacter sp. NRK P23]|uniref:hypothetical protein n=1 Tax=Parasegetibacter sp. NRK P23 TaxID=2942999 RepID=UPI002043A8DA|nr:hypothetical protein [Parasegetibacter sp. NRK P23]MCM5529115.1 hypothetical protein [Parasegetibacter sp. NRK P23]
MRKIRLTILFCLLLTGIQAQQQPVKPAAVTFVNRLPDVLKESSSLVYWDGGFWTHNDSDNTPFLFKIDTATGAILRSVWVKNAYNADWECLAQDDQYFYIGDTGDNLQRRIRKKIYIVSKAALSDAGAKTVMADTISFEYPERREGRMKLDAEAMVCLNGQLHLFTKETDTTRLFILPARPGQYYTAKYADQLLLKGRVTDAWYDSTTQHLWLLTSVPFGARYMYRVATNGRDLLKGKVDSFQIGTLLQCGQLEGMCRFRNNFYFTNEAFQGFAQSLWKWKVPRQ